MSDASVVRPHDIAAGEIHCWRGRCLDLFARGERAVDAVLEAAHEKDSSVSIRYLAGQRLSDLGKFAIESVGGSEKQKKALLSAIEDWMTSNIRRAFLAHGVSTILLDRQGAWHVQFDFTSYQSKRCDRHRWVCSKSEALEFEGELDRAFRTLSAQLGQLRKRISP